jgi:transcriptional regulator with XRE-family HTH domain
MIGRRLKLARAAAGLSVEELHAKLNVDIPIETLARYENDEHCDPNDGG